MQAEVPGGVLLTHASLRDPQLYVRKPAQADAQLDIAQSDHPRVQLLMVGHTHQQWAYSRQYGHLRLETGGAVDLAGRGICLLNPGSVGQSYGRGLGAARARFAMLDIASGRAKLHAIPYDASCCIEELRQAGLPLNALHRWQPILPMEFHRARGTLSRRVVQALRRLVAA